MRLMFYIWRSHSEVFKPKNTVQTVKHGSGVVAAHKVDGITKFFNFISDHQLEVIFHQDRFQIYQNWFDLTNR